MTRLTRLRTSHRLLHDSYLSTDDVALDAIRVVGEGAYARCARTPNNIIIATKEI